MSFTPFSSEARWICSRVVGGAQTSPPAPYLRTSFHYTKTGEPVRLLVTALGLYQCEINGRPVGDRVFVPGWTDYRKRVYVQSYDVTDLLVEGENVIGAILGDGWYCGHIGDKPRQQYGERPRFLAQLERQTEHGSEVLVCSDARWKTNTGPILESDLLGGEAYDARLELGDWSSPGYDDSAWSPVRVGEDPGIVLEFSEAPPVRRTGVLSVQSPEMQVPDSQRCRVFDLGQNFSGRIRLTVQGARGTHLKIRYAEILDAQGRLYTENLRGARATDFYTLKGGEVETWEPLFTFHGFRYVEITWSERQDDPENMVEIKHVEGIVLQSDTPVTGHFRCSHPLLNQLEHNIVWSQKSNFLEVPTDCPQRDERMGWTGDAQVFIRTAAFHMDVQSFFWKWLKDMRDAQKDNGEIPPVIPHFHNFMDGGPAWADAAFICPWTLYQCYQDLPVLSEHYDCMQGYMTYLKNHKVKDYIRVHPDVDGWGGFGDWLALDGSGRREGGTPKDLIGTAFYANNADIMAKVSELLGKQPEARSYQDLHDAIVAAFRRRFLTPDGLVAGGTQTAYVLALHFNLVPESARATAARELVRNIERNGMRLATGFVGTPYLLHVLEKSDYLDVAYQLLEQEEFPSWLFPVKNGATTIWEHWDGWTPDKGFQDKIGNSFNHYAYGAVGDWMVSTVAGLEIGEPGYQTILFKPRPGGTLTWAEASLETPHGKTSIHWKLTDGHLHLSLVIPQGCRAELSLPDGWQLTELSDLAPGKHILIAEKY